ncbi:glycosyltransferase [Sulfobacillus thermosulfidooxidans]|uniref:glycosyltransferase n=1 Tax=Sulfobacillus thermosulfidooxidans TaxID=28034 RepID=UPI00096B6A8A|nr:glycosyltransferase [Sulfobacillus thermosulfidooxidans]OLZ11994.1 hypothetical protein BFX05_05845 [Sulfobacillus thermosulfidooxidans]OLZ16755.1 hypothetical protein BFX06_14750 [Sulfobacillus thermosulfidooxidans]OLZ20697.1 hypothetical protein BFX07_14530 [Sulfobacillus thermosulfidooxidans]
MKHIVITSRELAGYNLSGGIGVYVDHHASSLAAKGYHVTVLTAAKFLEDRDEIAPPPERPYHIIPLRAVEGFRTAEHNFSYAVYLTLKELQKTQPFDIVEFPDYNGEGYFSIKAKRLLGEFAQVILWVHGHMTLHLCDTLNEEPPSLYRQAIYNMEQYCLRHADVVSVPSQDLAAVYGQDVPRDYYTMRHPIPAFTHPLLDQKGPNSSQDTSAVRVLYVGRLEHRKGVDLLVEAMIRQLDRGQNVSLRLVGGDTWWKEGSYRSYLLSLIPPQHQQAFEFMGPVTRENLQGEYLNADIVVFPSRFENWPNVCLEAMSFGKPIIASRFGGMREMLDGGAGWLIDPFDADAFDEALRELIAHPEKRKILGEKAQSALHKMAQASTELPTWFTNPPKVEDSISQDEPLVSIIVPCYNASETIEETLESLLHQDYPHIEIILVDDGSTEPGFAALLDRLGQAHNQVRVFHKTNSGLPGARNYGAKRAQGEYLAFCDADDLLAPMTIRHSVQALMRHQDLSLVYPIIHYFEGAQGFWGPQDLYAPTLLAENQAHAGIVIRRDRFFAHGGYDESFRYGWEDWELLLRLAKSGDHGEVLPYPHYQYRVRPNSMVRTTSAQNRHRIQKQMWTKHQELLGLPAYYVLDKEVLQANWAQGGSTESHREWLRRIILDSKGMRLVITVSRIVPGFIRRPVRRWLKQVVLRRFNLS